MKSKLIFILVSGKGGNAFLHFYFHTHFQEKTRPLFGSFAENRSHGFSVCNQDPAPQKSDTHFLFIGL